jgi:hypothetical protein
MDFPGVDVNLRYPYKTSFRWCDQLVGAHACTHPPEITRTTRYLLLEYIEMQGDVETVDVCNAREALMRRPELDVEQNQPLHHALRLGKRRIAVELLIVNRCSILALDEEGRTPLYYNARHPSVEWQIPQLFPTGQPGTYWTCKAHRYFQGAVQQAIWTALLISGAQPQYTLPDEMWQEIFSNWRLPRCAQIIYARDNAWIWRFGDGWLNGAEHLRRAGKDVRRAVGDQV